MLVGTCDTWSVVFFGSFLGVPVASLGVCDQSFVHAIYVANIWSLVCRLSSALISSDVLLQPYGGLFGTCSLSWDVFANLLCTEACLASVCSSLVRCFFCNPMEACLSPDRVSFGGFGIYGGSLVVCTLSCDGFGRPLEACFPSALSRALFFCKPTMEACLSCALSLFAFWAL